MCTLPESPPQPVQKRPNFTALDSSSPPLPKSAAKALYTHVHNAPLHTAAVYAIAGSSYALIMATAFLVATQSEFHPVRLLTLFWIYAWPIVLAVTFVAVTTRPTRLSLALLYFFFFALLGVFALAKSPTLSADQLVMLWLIDNFFPTALLLAFLNRRVRAVGPLVLTFIVLTLTGSILALSVSGSSEELLRSTVTLGDVLGLDAAGIFVALIVLGFAVFGLIGWLTLRWIRSRYERKQLSDQSLTLDAMWLLFSVVYPIGFVFKGRLWIFSGLVAFAVYKGVTIAGFSLLSHRAKAIREYPTLLLLRVFSLGKRSEQLFAALATYWRYGGSIRFIAGPDLVTATVEPHEFLDFVSGKLARRFIDGVGTLKLRISEEDLIPDHDGRFRVNDFFCHEDTWQMVLSRLVTESDVVLMDLRGFSSKNAGCVFEINELVNVAQLDRVVFVIDGTTEEQFLQRTVQQAVDQIQPNSPNKLFSLEQLHLFRFAGAYRGELQQLLRTLCIAATTAPSSESKTVRN